MKKKIVAGILVIIVVLIGYNVLKGKLDLTATNTDNTTQPPVTTTAPTVLEIMKGDIAKIQSEIATSKNNDAVIQAKLDQIIQMMQTLEAEFAALQK